MNADFSIVIPVADRKCLDETLASLFEDRRRYKHGKTEVIVLDGGEDGLSEQLAAVQNSCQKYGAEYVFCADTERGKRALGMTTAKYDYVLFIDSGARADLGTLDGHAEIYAASANEKIGGVSGVTVLTAQKTRYIKALEYADCTSTYKQALYKKYLDFAGWNNTSFPKKVLSEIGMPDNTLDLLCADDTDLCYRITKAGYKIKSAPAASVVIDYNGMDAKAVKALIARRGVADYHIGKRAPELLFKPLPSLLFICIFVLSASFITSAACAFVRPKLSWLPFSAALIYCGIMAVVSFFIDTSFRIHTDGKKKRNIIHYISGKMMEFTYRKSVWRERKLNKDRNRTCFMLFSIDQARTEYEKQAKKLKMAIIILAGGMAFVLIAIRIFIITGVAL